MTYNLRSFACGSARLGQRFQVALGAAVALAAMSLSPGAAQAYVVTVDGVQYDVTTFTGTYNDNTSKFETAANDGVMPWWESTMANRFAAAVGSSLGEPNISNGNTRSPIFANRFGTDSTISGRYWSVNGRGGLYQFFAISSESLVWAQATLYTPPAPAPAPLPLFGAAAAFGFSRRLSSRSKRLRHGASRLA